MAYFIDWDQVREGFDWVAIDQDGEVWAYMEKPIQLNLVWQGDVQTLIDHTRKRQGNWRELIFHRHESQAGF